MVLAYGLLASEPILKTGWAINIALALIIQPAESLVLLDAVPFFSSLPDRHNYSESTQQCREAFCQITLARVNFHLTKRPEPAPGPFHQQEIQGQSCSS